MELFADGIYSKTKVIQKIQPSPLRTSFLETDEAFGPLLPGNVVAPGATDRVLLLAHDESGLRHCRRLR